MENSKKWLPIGEEEFGNVIENNYYFVDKTLLMKDLILHRDRVNLITRPRRFGKSLNMSMLKNFFELSPKVNPPALFAGLKISEESALCEKYMGQYPVISITFLNSKQGTLQNSLMSLKRAISKEYLRHIEAVEAYPYFKERVDAIISGRDSEIAGYEESIQFLSEILYYYYGKKVIILIDEYDVPLESAYTDGYYEEMLVFIRSLLRSALKSNASVEFTVLTGCLKLAKESVFTGLNNFSSFSITDKLFAGYFGFTQDEVNEMLNYYGLDNKYREIREWYDGYTIGDCELYNPWSVVKQVKEYMIGNSEPVSHWANTSGNEIVKTLIGQTQATAEIEDLLAGNVIEKRIDEELTYGEVFHNIENLWSFLYYTGYLTANHTYLKNGARFAKLQIPNKEIRYIFEDKIKLWFDESIGSDRNDIYSAILQRNAIKLQEILNSILFRTISYMDYSESYYHGIMTGLLIQPDYVLKSNRETGLGRADITLENHKRAIIIELKVADSYNNLEAVCERALNQIKDNHYAAEFMKTEIILIGIAFCKKSCVVTME